MTFFTLSLDLNALVYTLQKDIEQVRDLHSAEIAEIKKILNDGSVSVSSPDRKCTIAVSK